jgi:hypothetical protein
LVRIGPTVWISIPDTHTHTHTNPDSTLYIRLNVFEQRNFESKKLILLL